MTLSSSTLRVDCSQLLLAHRPVLYASATHHLFQIHDLSALGFNLPLSRLQLRVLRAFNTGLDDMPFNQPFGRVHSANEHALLDKLQAK